MPTATDTAIQLGDVHIQPDIEAGQFKSLGQISVASVPLRGQTHRFLPWFDSYDGDVFSRFQLTGIDQQDDRVTIRTTVEADTDYPFRERRDSSGDLVLRAGGWDSQPRRAEMRLVIEPASAQVDGLALTGLRYWYEIDSPDVAIHRMLDRQTWELGGSLEQNGGVNLHLRNWLTPPRMNLGLDTTYSTVGLDKWAALLPGSFWARWAQLPAFDMQHNDTGVLLAWFDEVSLIRTVVETDAGEDAVRFVDMHLFEHTQSYASNAKTVLFAPEKLDDVDALNLWTRVYDQEHTRAREQFGLKPDMPPRLVASENKWRGFRFDTTYEYPLEVAAEFGLDTLFIDPVWEHGQAFQESVKAMRDFIEDHDGDDKPDMSALDKYRYQNMCCTLDFEVAKHHGGEAELKALCDRAAVRGVDIISWMSLHYTPNSAFREGERHEKYGRGGGGVIASRESGRHPDTGYPGECWTINLNTPIKELLREQLTGVCQRTGLKGFLWDSFINLGWWQIDYSTGSMRPQFDHVMDLFRTLENQGLYLQPEAVVSFCNHSCCGLHGGNVYEGDLLPYSYNTCIGMTSGGHGADRFGDQVLRGERPIDIIFQGLAHRRTGGQQLHNVPREQWTEQGAAALKHAFATYKAARDQMQRRTVLKGDAGVLYENDANEPVLFSFKAQPAVGAASEILSGESTDALEANRAYRVDVADLAKWKFLGQ